MKTVHQLDMLFDRSTRKAGIEFLEAAKAGILEHLRMGPAPGEQITDALKARGIVSTDDRHFGLAYRALSKKGLIVKHGHCERQKGNRMPTEEELERAHVIRASYMPVPSNVTPIRDTSIAEIENKIEANIAAHRR